MDRVLPIPWEDPDSIIPGLDGVSGKYIEGKDELYADLTGARTGEGVTSRTSGFFFFMQSMILHRSDTWVVMGRMEEALECSHFSTAL